MTILAIVGVYVIPSLITTALVSMAARYIENRTLDRLELTLSFLFWPYFLVALIIRLNSDQD